MHEPVFTSHSLHVMSSEPLASLSASAGLKATLVTVLVCPMNLRITNKETASQTTTSLPSAYASREPHREYTTLLITSLPAMVQREGRGDCGLFSHSMRRGGCCGRAASAAAHTSANTAPGSCAASCQRTAGNSEAASRPA